MHDLEAEVRELAAEEALDGPTAARWVAIERREVFSLFGELRVAMYVAVLLITSGLGLLIKAHLEHIGPPALLAAVGLAALACYANAVRTRRLGRERGIVGDYVLLLGALLVSADVGYAEYTYHLLGAHWSAHLLLLAALHGVTAYLLDSRLVLSLALTSFASWLGVDANPARLLREGSPADAFGARALACAAFVCALRAVHGRVSTRTGFGDVYAHFAANLALLGALCWCVSDARSPLGLLLLVPLAAGSVAYGLRVRQEPFVVYGVGYGALGLLCVLAPRVGGAVAALSLCLVTVVGAAILLWRLHAHLRAERA